MIDLDRIRAAGMPVEARDEWETHKARRLVASSLVADAAIQEATAGQVAALERAEKVDLLAEALRDEQAKHDELYDLWLSEAQRAEKAEAEVERLKDAGEGVFARYTRLVESGDAGFWDWREEDECKAWLRTAREEES